MGADKSENITQLLDKWGHGDRAALEELLPLVYTELRRLARYYLARERPNHTLQPTALVNEAYLRLVDQRVTRWQNRAQFFGIAAQLMRRILVDHARTVQAAKRGGHQRAVSLSQAEGAQIEPKLDLLALHEALNELAGADAQQAQIVELRYFGGLTTDEVAEVLGVSDTTVEREWRVARAWLRAKLDKG
jgi:RNA polymerase sigma factor (TIGR02999 family)